MDMSYLFYRRPASSSWTVSGTGAQFETDVRLSDGNPGVLTTVRWLSTGTPAIGDFVALRADWSAAITPLGACLRGLAVEGGSFPVGVKIEARGKRAGDVGYPYELGGSSLTQQTVELQDESIGAYWLFDSGLDPIIGMEIRIYNDRSSATWATASTYMQIGEADVFEGVALALSTGWQTSIDIVNQVRRTLGSQLHEIERVNYRVLEFALAPADGDDVRRQGLPDSMDWQRIETLLTRSGARAMVYVRATDDNGVFSSTELHSSAIYGRATPQPIVHVQDMIDRYTSGWRIEEVPAIV